MLFYTLPLWWSEKKDNHIFRTPLSPSPTTPTWLLPTFLQSWGNRLPGGRSRLYTWTLCVGCGFPHSHLTWRWCTFPNKNNNSSRSRPLRIEYHHSLVFIITLRFTHFPLPLSTPFYRLLFISGVHFHRGEVSWIFFVLLLKVYSIFLADLHHALFCSFFGARKPQCALFGGKIHLALVVTFP